MTNDAKLIIEKFGGINSLAAAINKNPATIYRWTYPKNKGGTNGLIPTASLSAIKDAAKRLNISLDTSAAAHSIEPMHSHQFVHWFRNTAPYIHAHRGKTFVINFTGDAVEDPGFYNLISDFALLNGLGIRLILVHGIRPQLEAKLQSNNKQSNVYQHLRITDKSTLQLVKEATGAVRSNIEALLSSSLTKNNINKTTIRVASGNFITARPLGVIDGVDYQFTGEVRRVDSEAIAQNLDSGSIVLVSPLAYSPTGESFNLRSEEIATEISTALQADKLILMTEKTELVTGQNTLVKQLTTAQAEQLLNNSAHAEQDTDLHLQEAIRASKLGVKRIHLINRKINGGLQLELFTRQGAGTLISAQPFEDARLANINDIQGIIELIRPLEERGILTYRSAEAIEMDIDKFHVIDQDGLITTCAALFAYPEHAMGELACVAVHPEYRTGERGDYLLSLIENKALAMGLTHLFVLTTQSSHWFAEKGFLAASLEDLPQEKRDNYNQTRRSNVLIKKLGPS
jgi:amino-acid N-acetyltransferase